VLSLSPARNIIGTFIRRHHKSKLKFESTFKRENPSTAWVLSFCYSDTFVVAFDYLGWDLLFSFARMREDAYGVKVDKLSCENKKMPKIKIND
jgi:hypothetical protein